MKIQLYVEGAGQKAADILLRKGFRGLIANDSGEEIARGVRIVACGNTNNTYKDFCNGVHTNTGQNISFAILVDSDTPVATTTDAWQAVAQFNGCGPRPAGAAADSAHMMVQVMESWIVADPANLKRFYGQNFNPGQLAVNPDIEQVPKDDILNGLKDATKNSKSGEYHKTRHGFDLIMQTDPKKLRARSFRAAQFLDYVRAKVG